MIKKHFAGIDYIRVMMSIFVVIWHMRGVVPSSIFSRTEYLEHIYTISDFIVFHMLYMAVPTFIFISNFLYAAGEVNHRTFKNRLKRILVLMTFWPLAFILFNEGYHGVADLRPHSIGMLLITVLRAGNTVYYFFVSLLISMIMTHAVSHLSTRLQTAGFILSTIFLIFLPELTMATGFYTLSAYWNPLNFLPFPFIAVLFAQNIDYVRSHISILVGISMILSVFFAVYEWGHYVNAIFLLGQGSAIPAYTRTSLLFCVIGLVMIAINPRIKSNRMVSYMARYSLALYCLHPFLIEPVRMIVRTFIHNRMSAKYASIFCVIVLSYTIAKILKRYYLKEEVVI